MQNGNANTPEYKKQVIEKLEKEEERKEKFKRKYCMCRTRKWR